MPELKHHFRSGKMNKDLDERLVPNGEYRDAQNIEISTSEGDDVGTIQNVLGTTLIKGKTYNAQTGEITANWPSADFGLTNPVCIGTKLNNENDKIYWFITSNEADCIAEYDDRKGIISPVLVDTNNILNFSRNQYITGINVLEEQLMWTDNTSEPKKIDIGVFKSGCSGNFTTHTKYNGSKILSTSNLSSLNDFVEENITVARKSPTTAPTLNMATSTRGGNGTGTSPVVISNSTAGTFTDSDGNAKASGTQLNLAFVPQPNFLVGDILDITATYEEASSQETFEIKVRVVSVSNSGSNCTVVIQSIPVEIPYVNLAWEAILSEEGVLFEKKFVRFSYRWKYKNGEYSVFAPFSELAFKPSTFEYLSTDGHNVGMINNLRELTINIPAGSTPIDVDEVDILFKESNNQLVYVVDTLKKDSNGNIDYSYKIESEIIGKVVESNQMLRPYDNIPRRALAQEVTANRLIYGNYLENFNIGTQNTPEIAIAVNQNVISQVREPELSVKSLRTYQVGVVYSDAYNRQTPVFTSNLASKQLGKSYADTVNTLTAQLSNTPPPWATHFRYYIKETSNEYYNLSMDRYYTAEDGNVWLSFPSSERNKVQEDTYLILKKQHDADTFVKEKARYKILDISNEAPDFIKLVKKALAGVKAKVKTGDMIPQVGSTSFKFLGPDPLSQPSFASGFTSEGFIQFSTASGKSEKYAIVSGGPTGQEESSGTLKYHYQVSIDEPIKDGDAAMMTAINASSNPSFDIILYQETFKRKPEFYGRFFVKINRDGQFDTNVIQTYPDVQAEFGIVNSRQVFANAVNTGPGDGRQEASWKDTKNKHNKVYTSAHPKVGSKNMSVYWTAAPGNKTKSFELHKSINSWLKALNTAGTLIRFVKNGNLSEVYVITASTIKTKYRRNGRKKLQSSKRREYRITFEHHLNGTPYEDGGIVKPDEIQIVEKVIAGDNEVLTSDNPAIWETEPKEAIDLDLYYETGNVLPISEHGNLHTLSFKNCYSFGNGVESNRLRDDFNAVTIDKGVRVSTVLAEQYKEERKPNSLIFSGIFNSTSGVNRLNQFIQGEAITKDMNPHYGSIQKLHARNTDLIVFCEDKVLKVLANKDALFEAGGSAQLTATNRVLGQAIPFVGEYGISNNPESFASYAFRVYFADKNRGAILRLSRDGLTAISENGMRDFFKDILPGSTLVLGSYDDSKGLYNLTLKNTATGLTKAVRSIPITKTVSFDEKVNGFPSFKSFIPEGAVSLNNRYYSMKDGALWVHTNTERNTFYGQYYDSSVTLLINDAAETIKGYKTLNYSGSRSKIYTNNYDAANNYASPSSTVTPGWHCDFINTDAQEGFVKEFKKKEGRYYNHIKGQTTTLSNLDSQEFSVQGIGQLSAISGDVEPDEKILTLGLTNAAGQATLNHVTVTGTTSFSIPANTSISSTIASTVLEITPNKGFTLAEDAVETSAGVGGSSLISNVTYLGVGDDGKGGVNKIQATVTFANSLMPNADTTANITVEGVGAEAIQFRLNDLALDHNTDSGITVTTSYSGSGTNTASTDATHVGFPGNYDTQYTVATKTFELASAKDFKVEPTFEILQQNTSKGSEDEYEITHQDFDAANTAVTIGVGGIELSNVSKRVYTIKYKFDAQDQSNDRIIFDAQSVDAAFDETDLITGYRVDGGSATVSRFAGTKNVYIYGKPAATFSLKNDLQITAASGTGSTITIQSGYEKALISFGAATEALAKASQPVFAVDLNNTLRGYFTNETRYADNTSAMASIGSQTWPTSANPSNPEVDSGTSYNYFKIKYYTTSNELKDVVIRFSTVSGEEGRILDYSNQQATTGDLFDFDNSIRPGMIVSSRTVSVPANTTVDSYLNGVITVSNPSNTTLPSISNGDTFNFEQYWEDGGFVSDSTASVTIPASGIYTVELPFSEVTTSTQYNLLLAAEGDSSLASSLTGNVHDADGNVANPFTVSQLADVKLSYGVSGKGLTMNTAAIDWTLADGDFLEDQTFEEDSVQIPIYSRIEKEFMANGYPVETSSFFRIPLVFSMEFPGLITQTRTPDITDFSNYDATGFDWDFQVVAQRITAGALGALNTYQILAYAQVERYGTISSNMDLLPNNFISISGLSNPGGGRQEIIVLTTTKTGYTLHPSTSLSYTDEDGNSVTNTDRIKVGTPANTIITFYVKIQGDFSGQTVNSVFKDFSVSNSGTGSNAFFDLTYGTGGISTAGTKFDGGSFTSTGNVYETSVQLRLANTVVAGNTGSILFDFNLSGGGGGSGTGGPGTQIE